VLDTHFVSFLACIVAPSFVIVRMSFQHSSLSRHMRPRWYMPANFLASKKVLSIFFLAFFS
jgi:hypothetical protein